MSGHSKWAQIKHRKAGADAKRGALFSKLARIISVAARESGANPEANAKLRQAMDQAKSLGLPKDNIERAIARAASAADIANLKSVEYEAFGPGGSALIADGLTDNSNRTTNEVKRILADHAGRLADSGSVAWMFERKAIAVFPLLGKNSEEAELAFIDAGAEDTVLGEDEIEAIIPPEKLQSFLTAALSRGFSPSGHHLTLMAKSSLSLSPENQKALASLLEALDDHPDINDVSTNAKGF